ncbi:Uncharacterized protein conserved in bacteria (DUF2326) [Klebsiella pneumoniae]|uniref:DUF2326 domain-containing protein n=1 Tax=Klebsiella pneumoniae TaxID=573 RepID=UPI0009BAA890|nr:DUF2326 domain-containing protein [Klebsiella pneumoniae]SLR72000.1 Uncharacterized protein conserved in bacteria (DUF2326) [Klebsiella pneumoniae]SLT23739.1 Uncharacterized protein conserved in bacteria (DUF2326) [Klebsiella pneumoniae]SLT28092.1 Uncharacterized protein conserved in bacteria (DUF2326) [Klebsiella pneumoniae]SLT41041.1 Uncharacterized protein conserved in bacteria (DUF2326) [Klebsiella pneumoniae]SLT86555.1 Uncharacterized protein conserved in bacteria (DUF2326) [Klebsiella
MRLNKLIVFKNNAIVREVTFKDGLNLIVNKRTSGKDSGNSVGKSTLSRVLDYLFMSSGNDIYHDAEFGKDIPEIVSLINDNILRFTLDFNTVENKKAIISRTISTDEKNSKYYLSDIEVDKKQYYDFIAQAVFGLTTDKPSLRNVSHKFIRNTNEKMQKTLNFLHANTTSDVYDLLYLFLFGFNGLPLIKKKGEFNKDIKKQKAYLAAYRNPNRETVLSKMIKPLKKEIAEAEKNIKNFDFKDSHDESLKKLSEIQRVISDYSLTYASLNMRVRNIEESILSLKNNITQLVEDDLIEIYNSAGLYFKGELKRSYEEMVLFHNDVIKNKINFLESELLKKKEEIDAVNEKINDFHEQESSLFKTIKEPETLKSINQLFNKLTELRENLASIETNLTRINDTNALIKSLEDSRGKLLEEIELAVQGLEKNIEIFNEFFGDLTKEIYGERYIFDLSFDIDKGKCNFDISCVTPNSNGGKKKGEITAFDLAYIKFVDKVKLKRPTFVIHDSIEDVDVNQIRDIFFEANNINGQYIVSILSDKFSEDVDLKMMKNNSILELSSTNKFFKV